MNPIVRQARFAREVGLKLQDAASEGKIRQSDEYLTSEEAGRVYAMCDDQWTVEEVVEILIEEREDKYDEEARRMYGGLGSVPSGEELRAILHDAGRPR